MGYATIDELIDKFILKVEQNSDEEIRFYLSNGAEYTLHHEQDCCEYVHIESVDGDLDDLVGTRLLKAEETFSSTGGNNGTWTFYNFATIKGYVTIRWYGTSNGYYSESATLSKTKEEDPIREQRFKKLSKLNIQLK